MAGNVDDWRKDLDEYALQNVKKTKEETMVGSYGKVEVVEINKLRCALKTLHSYLNVEFSVPLRNFVEECRTLSKMKHPNIVQFLGVHFSDDSSLPGLVMEWLPFSLPKFLMQCRERRIHFLAEELKYSILFDVAKGMHYLHSQHIIHRDLSPNNVLLTYSLTAKIADLGVIKFIDPKKTAKKYTIGPGTPLITAPEALNGIYGTPVDVFAFSVLILMVSKVDWPADTKEKEVVDEERDLYRLIPPLERYQPEIDKYIPKGNALREWIMKCLAAKPEKRPSSDELVSAFATLTSSSPSPFTDILSLLQSKEEARQLKSEVSQMQAELNKLRRRNEPKPDYLKNSVDNSANSRVVEKSDLEKLTQKNMRLQEENAELRRTNKLQEDQLEKNEKLQGNAQLLEEQQHRHLRRQIEDLKRSLAEAEESKSEMERELIQQRRRIDELNNMSISVTTSLSSSVHTTPPSLQSPLPPTLNKDELMPLVDNENARLRIKEVRQATVSLPHIKGAQAVIIQAKVYVGRVSPSLWVYDVLTRSWNKLPQDAPVRNYALANFQDQLALVGGSGNTQVSKLVYIWAQDKWDPDRIRPMIEERENPVAVGFEKYLVVMGGSAAKFRGLITTTLRSIEVFNPDQEQWLQAALLPRASYMLQSVAQDGFLYILSSDGWTVRYCSLAELVHSSGKKSKGDPWRSITRSVPHTQCCIAVFNKTLLAIAGAGSDGSIYAYDPKNTRWQKTASHNSLPAIKNACCVPVGMKELFLCGGDIDLMTEAPQSAYNLSLDETVPK